MRDVVDAVAHDEADRPVPRSQQRREVLAAEVAGERPTVRRAMQLAAAMFDRRADGDELSEFGPPLIPPDLQPDADDAVGAELIGLFLHPRHRELTGVVHRLREDGHLLVLTPVRLLK